MKVDEALIKRIAELARLNLTDKEIEKFKPQFKEILDLFSQLDEVNTDNVKPSCIISFTADREGMRGIDLWRTSNIRHLLMSVGYVKDI